MNLKTISSGATALLVAGLLFGNTLSVSAAPQADTGAEIKAAAAALVASREPGLAIDHIEIDLVVPNYATARVFPNQYPESRTSRFGCPRQPHGCVSRGSAATSGRVQRRWAKPGPPVREAEAHRPE